MLADALAALKEIAKGCGVSLDDLTVSHIKEGLGRVSQTDVCKTENTQ